MILKFSIGDTVTTHEKKHCYFVLNIFGKKRGNKIPNPNYRIRESKNTFNHMVYCTKDLYPSRNILIEKKFYV